jgi:hypothetical protein
MRTQVKIVSPETKLLRLLNAFAKELIEVSEEEIMEAAQSLGMDPQMKGSAAFAGLKYPATPAISDFFGREIETRPRLRRSRRTSISTEKKGRADD